jgi:hypothetical protein
MLHWSSIYNVIEQVDSKGMHVEFSIVFAKRSTGEWVKGDRCVCTSSYFRPRTINVRFVESEEIRTIRCCSIKEINGVEVYI